MRGFLNKPIQRSCLECKQLFFATKCRELYCSLHIIRSHRWAYKLKQTVYTQYGNICGHCGFTDQRAFQLDHVNGGGTKERKEKCWNYQLVLLDARKNPTKYQLLCANCNAIKRYTNSEIPYVY